MDAIPLKSLLTFVVIWLIIALCVIVRPVEPFEAFLVVVVYCVIALTLVRNSNVT
jgi:uncharacterized membrane protein